MPAFAQVHFDAAITLHVVLEQHAIFRVLLIEQHAVLGPREATRQFR